MFDSELFFYPTFSMTVKSLSMGSEVILRWGIDYSLYGIDSTLTAIIFLHYRVATKMALEILGFDCDGW